MTKEIRPSHYARYEPRVAETLRILGFPKETFGEAAIGLQFFKIRRAPAAVGGRSWPTDLIVLVGRKEIEFAIRELEAALRAYDAKENEDG